MTGGGGNVHRSMSARAMSAKTTANDFGDEIVPDLKLNKKLVDSIGSTSTFKRQAHSSVSLPGSFNGNRFGRSFSGPASPAGLFLGRLNSQLSSPSEGVSFGSVMRETDQKIGAYKLGRVLGTGGFSVVREAHNGNNKVLAVKIVDKRHADVAQIEHEREIWQGLSHPHILPLLDVQDTTNSLYLFTLCVPEGSLHDLVRRQRRSEGDKTRSEVRSYLVQLVEAVKYLHNYAKVIHRDIKLENCLLESERGLQLCDFGLSQYMDEVCSPDEEGLYRVGPGPTSSSLLTSWSRSAGTNSNAPSGEDGILPRRAETFEVGTMSPADTPINSNAPSVASSYTETPPFGFRTRNNSVSSGGLSRKSSVTSMMDATRQGGSMHYAAPELLTPDSEPGSGVDIWALGVVFYTALAGKYPWHHSLSPKLRTLILTTDYDELAISDLGARAIIARCLVRDPDQRAQIDEIYDAVVAWAQKDASAGRLVSGGGD